MKLTVFAIVFPAVLGYLLPPFDAHKRFAIQKNPEFLVESGAEDKEEPSSYDAPVFHILGESDRAFAYKPEAEGKSSDSLSGFKQVGWSQEDVTKSGQWQSPPEGHSSIVGMEHHQAKNFYRHRGVGKHGKEILFRRPFVNIPESTRPPSEVSSLIETRVSGTDSPQDQKLLQDSNIEQTFASSEAPETSLIFPSPPPASELEWIIEPQIEKDCHNQRDKTILQVLEASPFHKRLYALIKDDVELSDELTEDGITFFAPTDEAIGYLQEHHFSDEKLIRVLPYHLLPELYDSHRLLSSRVLQTTLKSNDLVQHLRVSTDLNGLKLNFYSRVVFKDIHCKNGIIHAVNSVIIPPPEIKEVLNLFADHSSTFLYAVYKTGLIDQLKGTVFVPSNSAFSRLPPKVRFFLFSKWGESCLKKILQFHIAPKNTVYMDVPLDTDSGSKHYSINVPTLLEDRTLNIDVFKFGYFSNVRINGESLVTTTDIVAKDGVVQNTWKMILPPKKLPDGGEEEYDLTVEHLIEALGENEDNLSGWKEDYPNYSTI